jgi:hypothetical protein
LFWWSFEFVNRFVGNWLYSRTGDLSASEYFIEASLPFSTVLPAVASTAEWLGTFPGLHRGLEQFWKPALRSPRRAGFASLLAGISGLMAIALFPQQLYPLVWIAPLLIISGLQASMNFENPLWTALATGDWRQIWLYALAGLVCGFFWELWNYHSLAHWKYQISYVGRFKLFEMPILGYAGYLPFGILCGIFADSLHPGWLNRNLLSAGKKSRYDGEHFCTNP